MIYLKNAYVYLLFLLFKYVLLLCKAAGCAASQCRHRSDISSSGIIPVLGRLAISCQSHSILSNNIPPQPSTLSSYLDNNNPPYSTQFINTQAHVLTAAHTELLQACISAGHYHHACEFTDKYPVLSTQPYKPITCVTAEQYLRYFYLLGIARLGMNRYHDAKMAFEIGITVPSRAVSAVTIACKKKYLLVKCLLLREEQELLVINNNKNKDDMNVDFANNDVESMNNTSEGESSRINNSLANRMNRKQKRSMNSPKVGINQNQNQSPNTVSESYQRKSLKDLIHEIPQCTYPVVSRFFNSSSSFSSSNETMRGSGDGGIVGEEDDGMSDTHKDEYHHANAKESKFNRKHPKFHGIQVYNEIVDAFVENDYELFQKIKSQNEELLRADGNWGLVNQVQENMEMPRTLYKIAKLYEAIPISKLAKKLNLSSVDEAEAAVREMMMKQVSSIDINGRKPTGQKDSFNAQIDDEEGVIYFLVEDVLSHNNESAVLTEQKEFTTRIRKCMELTERMQNIDIALTTSPKYAGVFKYLPNSGTAEGNERESGDEISSTPENAGVTAFSVEL